jgi:hypothetical protein
MVPGQAFSKRQVGSGSGAECNRLLKPVFSLVPQRKLQMQTRKALIDLRVAKTWFAAASRTPVPLTPHSSVLTPHTSLLTPHLQTSPPPDLTLTLNSVVVPTRRSPSKDRPSHCRASICMGALRRSNFVRQPKRNAAGGPRTRSRAARSAVSHQSSLARAPHFAPQSAGTRPSTFHLPIAERRLVSNTSPRQLHLHLHLRPSSSIATFYNCTFDILGRATHSVVVVAVSSSTPIHFRTASGQPAAKHSDRPTSENSPGARPTPFPNTKPRRSHSHRPNKPGRCCRA